jgi:N-dimethylarginine dimethylaminohydrolase
MKVTCHSEYGKIRTLFIKSADAAFVDDKSLSNEWRDLNFLGKPDFNRAKVEYETFERLLKVHHPEILHFPFDSSVNIDSIYCRDAALATDAGMIICNMGKPARRYEPEAEKRAFEQAGVKVLGKITSPGTLEGGDAAWIDDKTLSVGHTYRTNEEGIRQLADLLKPLGVEVITVPLPHYKGPSDVFHLMSILSPVDLDLAVVYSPLMPILFRNNLIRRGFSFVEVPEDEFESMGCNVLAIAPRQCLIVKGNPKTKSLLEKAGCKVFEYDGDEISVKGGGGPTCPTRPILREI